MSLWSVGFPTFLLPTSFEKDKGFSNRKTSNVFFNYLGHRGSEIIVGVFLSEISTDLNEGPLINQFVDNTLRIQLHSCIERKFSLQNDVNV